MEENIMRYFELGLGNSVEEDWETFDYSMCIKGEREPLNFEEVNMFIRNDLQKLGYKTVVSITEIPESEAKAFFDWDSITKAPVFK
jgi:hypothetical protein